MKTTLQKNKYTQAKAGRYFRNRLLPVVILSFFCVQIWGQAMGFSNGSTESFVITGGSTGATLSNETTAINIRTGNGALKVVSSSGTRGVAAPSINMSGANMTIHTIFWAKSSITHTITSGYMVYVGSDRNKINISFTTNYNRYSNKYYQASKSSGYMKINPLTNGNTYYIDDVVQYCSAGDYPTDLDAPNKPGNTSGTLTGGKAILKWTSGGDTKTTAEGATGVQATLVLKYTGTGTPTALTLNPQADYTVSDNIPSNWSLITGAAEAAETGYDAGAISATTYYAVYHRDMAYNWSSGEVIPVVVSSCTPITTAYDVTGAATICTGATTAVGLSNSQSDVTYKLYKDANPTPVATQAGTGSAISFGLFGAGVYTVKGTGQNAYCTTETAMTGSSATVVEEICGTTYTLTTNVNPANSGTTTGAGTYAENTEVAVTATANRGYVFNNWTGATVTSGKITMTGDITLTANFTSATSLTVTATKGLGAATASVANTTNADGNFFIGDAISFSATGNAGYTFLGWYNGESSVSTNNPYATTVSGALTLEARYTANTPTISEPANKNQSVTGVDATHPTGGSITTITFTLTNASGATISDLPAGLTAGAFVPNGTGGGTITITGAPTTADVFEAKTYTVTAVGLEGYTGSPVTKQGTITITDPNIKNVAYVTSKTGTTLTSDPLYTYLGTKYQVTAVTAALGLNFSAYDLVIADDVIGGGNHAWLNPAFDKPFLNLKAFFYSSNRTTIDRWSWGGTDNGTSNGTSITINEPYHPILSGLSLTGNKISILNSSPGTKSLQGIVSVTQGYNIGQVAAETSTNNDVINIHEIPVGGNKPGSGNTTNKYMMISIVNTAYSFINADGFTLIKNACDYLMSVDNFDGSASTVDARAFRNHAPVATAATAKTATGFTANWDKVLAGVKYYITVFDNGTPVTGWDNKEVNDVATYDVTGLESSKTYTYTIIAENAATTKTVASNAISVTTLTPPTLTSTTQDAAVCDGNPVKVNIAGTHFAAGNAVKYKIGTGTEQSATIEGTTGAYYFMTGNIAIADNGETLTLTQITNSEPCSLNATTNNSFVLAIKTTTAITRHPESAVYNKNQTPVASLTADADGTNLNFAWYKSTNATTAEKNGASIGSGKTLSLTGLTATPGMYYYFCEVTGDCGSTQNTNIATIEVKNCNTPEPQTLTATTPLCAGQNTTISIEGGGQELVTYQLFEGTATEALVSWTVAPPVGTTTYTLKTVEADNFCAVTLDDIQITVNALPTFSTDLSTEVQTLCEGQTISVAAADVTYQWYRSDAAVLVNTSTNASYAPALSENGKRFYCIIKNGSGCTKQSETSGIITVNHVPNIYTVSGDATVCATSNSAIITLSNSENGINYQLYADAAKEQDAKASTGGELTWTVTPSANTTYTVKVEAQTGICAKDMTGSATVTVTPAAKATSLSPALSTISKGGSAAITLAANYAGTISWEMSADNGTTWLPAAGSTNSATYNTTSTLAVGSYQFKAVLTPASPCTETDETAPVTVTVQNTDASLKSLTIDNSVLDPEFASNTLNYTVVLPFGTSAYPVIVATPTDENATVTTPFTYNPVAFDPANGGKATIKVTAEDGKATETYTITFKISADRTYCGIPTADKDKLSVTASGTAPFSYQWYKSETASTTKPTADENKVGTDSNTLIPVEGTWYYYCVVSNVCGDTPSAWSGKITVNPLPTITGTPTVACNTPSNEATVTVTASNLTPTGNTVSYTIGSTPATGIALTKTGETTATFTVPAPTAGAELVITNVANGNECTNTVASTVKVTLESCTTATPLSYKSTGGCTTLCETGWKESTDGKTWSETATYKITSAPVDKIVVISGSEVEAANVAPNNVASFTANTLEIEAGGKMTTSTATVNAGEVIFNSNDTQTAQLMNTNIETATLNANVIKVQKKFDKGKWYHISMPFDVVKVTDIDGNELVLGVGFYAKEYDAARRASGSYNQTSSANWVSLGATGEGNGILLKANKGYQFGQGKLGVTAEKPNGDVLVLYSKEGASGTVQVCGVEERNYTLNLISSDWDVHKNWNFVGNPYTTGFNLSELSASYMCYVYEKTAGGYVTHNDDDYILPPYQAFMIQAKSTTLGFNAEGPKFRSLNPASKYDEVELDFSSATYTDIFRARLHDEGTTGLDLNIDGYKIFDEASVLVQQIYSKQDGYMFAINALPRNVETTVVPVAYFTPNAGAYTISYKPSAKSENINKLILVDKVKGIETDLLATPAYTINTVAKESNATRFELIIGRAKDNVETGIPIVSTESKVIVSAAEKQLIIHGLNAKATVSIFDLTGKKVATYSNIDNNQIIPTNLVGIYMVKVENATQKTTVKVILK